MTREELLGSYEYWLISYQNNLCKAVSDYFDKTKKTPAAVAQEFSISISTLNKIMTESLDGSILISTMIRIMIKCGYCPFMLNNTKLTTIEEYIELDKISMQKSTKNIKNFL